MAKKKKKVDKEFGLSSWAINNKTTIYVVMVLILILGISAYFAMPRENFPEIRETKIYISSVFPGNTAEDIEKLITDPLEDKLKTVSNVVEITSTSQEDYSIIIVEFDENLTVDAAKQKVKDEVDSETSSEDWPTFNGAKVEPNVFELSLSEELPILNINISGDYPVQKLKEFGEYLQDEIEDLQEIKEVAIRGAQDKEVEVAVDIYKMMAAQVSFNDVINAINNENVTMSAGNLIASGQRRTIRILGEIDTPNQLENFVVKSEDNSPIYLKDIATVSFKEKERTTYAREFEDRVVMLDVKKRSGKNMVAAAEQIQTILKETKENNILPSDLKITVTNDQSSKTIGQVDDLVNNIIFGIILVVTVLMFFLGFKNALFVGFAIPMSMFMSLMILNALGYTMNTMILFGLIMGLGMLVDNGIVVVENVYRLMDEEGLSRVEAAKKGIGEIAFPIIISTLTTVAAFIPLGLWPGVMGQFMIYFPVTLSVVLGSSLFVAIFFNSVMVSQFMSTEDRDMPLKRIVTISSIVAITGILILLFGGTYKAIGSIMIFTAIMLWVYRLVLRKAANYFQNKILPRWERFYEKALRGALKGWRPIGISVGTFILLFIAFGGFGASVQSQRTKVEFFPDNSPNQIIVYIEYPEGTDIEKTNTITSDIEKRVYTIINSGEYLDTNGENFLVESSVSQVGEGAGNPQTDGGSAAEMPHRGKITASMREYKFRKGADSKVLQKKIQEALKGIYPGVAISVEKDAVGPPAGYPINIELEGDNYVELITTAEAMKSYLNTKNIPGIDELKIDVNRAKPAMQVKVDRKKSGELGVSTGQVGQQLRNSIFGAKAGIYKEGGDDYDIYVRFNKDNKYNTSAIFNQNITFRDNSGKIKEIPISTVAKQVNSSGFSAIKHKDVKRVVTVYSALAPGFTDAGAIVAKIQSEMLNFNGVPNSVKIDYTGQIEEQAKQMSFLMGAFFTGLGLIFFILIFQFNSVSKPGIIMLAIFLSLIGVFGGIVATGSSFVIMMTMMGIISLAGIVVNNGVVLLDYTQLLIDRKKEEQNLDEKDYVDNLTLLECVIKAGKARLRPVLLTAITTILGLIPLATGLNINFYTLFSEFDANIYVGGDNVIFWGPLAWTVIYGLFIATFLTLVVVPILFYLVTRFKMWLRNRSVPKETELVTGDLVLDK
ncbi:efflux RND transporter permease subunit [Flavobacteriaceae bacterium AU392]|nr:efflux RND transporter permease subunit [Flavobacteriaceae bacterium]RKM86632.1 efflux RND transporter permease subunit [Flavobacteriaceae bacterium AU392]